MSGRQIGVNGMQRPVDLVCGKKMNHNGVCVGGGTPDHICFWGDSSQQQNTWDEKQDIPDVL